MNEIIFKGATRPAMFFGIPLMVFGVVAGCGFIVAMWGMRFVGLSAPLFVASIVVPLLLWARFVTQRDDQRLLQYFIWMKLHAGVATGVLAKAWGGPVLTYSPVLFRGKSDGRRF